MKFKNNKKGFTLVELLAVIVILGVLLLIAVPAVQNIISSSKKKSFESAAKLMIENAETAASLEKYSGDGNFTKCYVEVTSITLERGNAGTNATGYVLLEKDTSKDKIVGTINYANDDFQISNGTLENIGVSVSAIKRGASFSASPPSGTSSCSWWLA